MLSLKLLNIKYSINKIKVFNNNIIIINIKEFLQYFKKKHLIYRGGIQSYDMEFYILYSFIGLYQFRIE